MSDLKPQDWRSLPPPPRRTEEVAPGIRRNVKGVTYRACGAKLRGAREGMVCAAPAMVGQARCAIHGGRSPRGLAGGRRRVAVAKATKAISRENLPPLDDPIRALRELASEALAVKSYFADRVNALEQLRYQAGSGEQVRGELLMYGAAFDRAAKLCESLARLNLDERTTRVDEARIVLLVAALDRVLGDPELGLDVPRRERAANLLVAALEAP